jgi:hypothetical protein
MEGNEFGEIRAGKAPENDNTHKKKYRQTRQFGVGDTNRRVIPDGKNNGSKYGGQNGKSTGEDDLGEMNLIKKI